MEEDPQLFQQFKGHKDAITASHFSPNGKQVNNVSPTISAIVIFLHMKANRDIIDGSMIKDLWHNTIGIIILRFMLCKVVSSSLDHSLMLWRFQSSDSKAYRCPIIKPKQIPHPP